MFKKMKMAGLLIIAGMTVETFAAEAWILCDTAVPQVKFSSSDIETALVQKGYQVSIKSHNDLAAATTATRIIIGMTSNANVMTQFQATGAAAVGTIKAQGYAIRITGVAPGTYWIIGSEPNGAMYGGLDFAQTVRLDGLAGVATGDHAPYLAHRGIKLNIPLDARTPSYSDAGSSAWANVEVMWDFEFWKTQLDNMARYHWNVMSLWNCHPFPSLIKVPEYPNVALSDVKKNTIVFEASLSGWGQTPSVVLNNLATVKTMTIDGKIAFWRKVMEYGRDRGVEFHIMTWNIHTYGADGKNGITTSPGTVTTDYFRKSVRTLFLTYPLLAGIGVTTGEVMQGQGEPWLWSTYAQGILDAKKDPSWPAGRKVRFIHRLLLTSVQAIQSAFSGYPDTFDFCNKYSRDHAFSSPTDVFVKGFTSTLPAGKQTWWEVRGDDFYLLRWGDPEYVRAYIKSMPTDGKVEGFFHGSDGYTWGREFVSTDPDSPRQLVFDKFWFNFMLWGNMGYDPNTPSSLFQKTIAYKFPEANSVNLYEAWTTASKITPLQNRFYWAGSEDDKWYPEACYGNPKTSVGFHKVTDFIGGNCMQGQKMVNIRTYAHNVRVGQTMTDTTPVLAAQALKGFAATALAKITAVSGTGNKELSQTVGDIRAMAYLGSYYAEKILGATFLCLRDTMKTPAFHDSAIAHLRLAATHWRSYAAIAGGQYTPQIIVRQGVIPMDLKAFMSKVLNDIAIAGGSAQMASTQPSPGGTILEAEVAKLQGGSVVTANSGNTGTGYADFRASATGSIQWTFNAPKAGVYTLEFRYAQDSTDVPAILSVNGTAIGAPISFWTTGGTSVWQTETRSVILTEGSNTITLTAQKKWAAIDHVNIIPVATPVVHLAVENSAGSVRAFMRLGRVTVNVRVPVASPVECTLFNACGQRVSRLRYTAAHSGSYLLTMNTQNLLAGCYILSVNAGNTELVKKVTVVR